jgi:Amt family ammonium transporter
VTLEKVRIDDLVGAISVHGDCGLFGLLLVPLTSGGSSFFGQIVGRPLFLSGSSLPA